MIKAVFCDVDNTLTSSKTRTIPASALEAIHKARKNGVKVFAATGRHTRTYEEGKILQGIALDGYVAVNGQLCYLPDDTIIHKAVLDPQDVIVVLRLAKELNFACCLVETDMIYLTAIDENVRSFHEMIKIPFPVVASAEGAEHRDVLSVAPYIDYETEELITPHLRNSEIVRFNPFNCDVIPRQGGKDVGMQAMLDYFDVPIEQAMAIGDGQNDISMLKAAGVGVAIGQCSPEVMAAADYHAPGADENGIRHTFEKFGII
jgi:Cof subfamily protein (haloacid dehalogenase superfamily)